MLDSSSDDYNMADDDTRINTKNPILNMTILGLLKKQNRKTMMMMIPKKKIYYGLKIY